MCCNFKCVMSKILIILLFGFLAASSKANAKNISFKFYGDDINFVFAEENFVEFEETQLSDKSINQFYNKISTLDYSDVILALTNYQKIHHPDDWLFYQLVRSVAQQISPKTQNYLRYTLYKWYFMIKAGYGTMLGENKGRLLFYIQCDENIYNIPYRTKNGKQYVCLNYHDYGSNIDFKKESFMPVNINLPPMKKTFSYAVTQLPSFEKTDYVNKNIRFSYNENEYNFKIKINPQITKLFNNYPTVDYKNYINIPVSNETYQSLISLLKKQVRGLNPKNGVDYLMHFTRYAFAFEQDTKVYGGEKRLSPEQTLLSPYSDCEDRVGLFFFLVKEIYNLPMIVLAYPNHVTIAIEFNGPASQNAIEYNGKKYTVCEPTPQTEDLRIGEILPELKKEKYHIDYAYNPQY